LSLDLYKRSPQRNHIDGLVTAWWDLLHQAAQLTTTHTVEGA
jgi:hypothetical protein